MRNIIISALVIILAIGCKQRPDYIVIESKSDNCKVLNLDPVFEPIPWDTTTISDIVDTIKIVALGTTRESILSRISKLKIFGDRMVIHDGNEGIAIFDINGKHIRHIRRGQGPGEINASFDFDADSQYLYILQQDKISKFTLDGEFVEYYPLPEKYMTALDKIKKIDDGFLLSKYPFSSEAINYEAFLTDDNLNEKNHFVFEHKFVGFGGSDFKIMDGKIVFYISLCNTIFQFDGKTFSPYCILNYPKYENTFETNPDRTNLAAGDFFRVHCKERKYFFDGHLYKTSNVLCLSFMDMEPRIIYLDTQNGKFRAQLRPSDRDMPYQHLLYDCGGIVCEHNDYIVRTLQPEYYLTEPVMSEAMRAEIQEKFNIDLSNTTKVEKDKDWYSKLEHISAEDVLKLKNAKNNDNPLLVFIKFKHIPDDPKN